MRLLTRSKSRFKSARAAWIDIGAATGLEPNDVRSAGHTRTQWRWTTSISNRKRSKTMAKRRSAKQRANDKRLGAMARARGRKPRRSTPKRRRKVNKARRRTRIVAARRRTTSKRSIISKIPFINNPTIRKVATGIGIATIGAAAIGIVAPQIAANPIIKPALALIGGGIPGLIGQVVTQGGFGAITNLIGGNAGTVNQAGNSGFA